MKNKRGFLLAEETLKIVLSVISIGFLIYFLSALYFANQNSKDYEFADAALKKIILNLDSKSSEVQVFNPEGWALVSFSSVENSELFPKSCSNFGWQKCLCITESALSVRNFASKVKIFDDFETATKKGVDDSGVCAENDYAVLGNGGIIVFDNLPLTFELNNKDKTISAK